MRQVKDLAITIMYIYIFVLLLKAEGCIAVFILMCLVLHSFNFYKSNFEKKLQNQLFKQRENFINLLSHDIRIPVIAQIRALELLKGVVIDANNWVTNGVNRGNISINNTKTEEVNDIIVQTEESCRYVLNLLSLMINSYGIENNTYKLVYERFNISDVVVSCINKLSSKAKDKNITFVYKCGNKNMKINADKIELKKVIYNTLSSLVINANFGDEFIISLIENNNKIKLTIEGNRNETNIYSNSNYKTVGENIKMWFCKRIIELHKGKILSNNKSLSFELPILSA